MCWFVSDVTMLTVKYYELWCYCELWCVLWACFLFTEYTATKSVHFAIHRQDIRTTNNWPLYFYATTSCTTHQTQPFLWCVYESSVIDVPCLCTFSYGVSELLVITGWIIRWVYSKNENCLGLGKGPKLLRRLLLYLLPLFGKCLRLS